MNPAWQSNHELVVTQGLARREVVEARCGASAAAAAGAAACPRWLGRGLHSSKMSFLRAWGPSLSFRGGNWAGMGLTARLTRPLPRKDEQGLSVWWGKNSPPCRRDHSTALQSPAATSLPLHS